MSAWSKEAAKAELTALIKEIVHLSSKRGGSADHTRWLTRTVVFLEEVFGRESRYLQAFLSLPWSREGEFLVDIRYYRDEIEREHQAAYLESLECAKGILQAAVDHLERVDDIAVVYEGKDTAPEASAILKIINLAERKLRKALRERPSRESEVQDAFENLLIGADISYKREKERIEYSSKTYTPDFTFPRLELALDLKFCGSDSAEPRLIKEINDYILAFQTKYANLIFVVYDLGFVRDIDLFAGSFEQHQGVIVRVIKH
jgi:hypothetical protein